MTLTGFRVWNGMWRGLAVSAVLLFATALPSQAATAVRIKDLGKLHTGDEIQLTGLGLVIGLEGTGDGRQASFTLRMLSNMMKTMNLTVNPAQIRVRNVAAVSVTAVLSPYARPGSRVDVQTASLGDAGSLQGGTLLRTPMVGPNGKEHVQAQGSISIGGFNLGGGGAGGLRKNHTVVGYVPNGGIVVKKVEQLVDLDREVDLLLYEADWTTAVRAAWAIDEFFGEFGLAQAVDAGTVVVRIPDGFVEPQELTEFIANIEMIKVVPDLPARVVVNERTGTVIIGENVSVSAVALSHGSLKLKIPGDATGDLFGGEAEVVEETDHLHPIISSFDVGAMPTVRELVRNLNALGVTPRDLISILQSLKVAGALRAELVIQ